MEIERKFLADPASLDLEMYAKTEMTQGYLFTDPVLRIRQKDDSYILTVKSGGLLAREEYEIDLTREQYENMAGSVKGLFIRKTRYLIPCPPYTIELDLFHGSLEGLIYAEVEFPSIEEAEAFVPPSWFGREVTEDGSFTNAALSKMTEEELSAFLQRLRTL